MANELSDETLNRLAHEYLGRCWHEWKQRDGYNPNIPNSWNGKDCVKCATYTLYNPSDGHGMPDYCTDRNAAAEVVRKAVKSDNKTSWAFNESIDALAENPENGLDYDEAILLPPRVIVEAALKAAGRLERD